MNGEVGEEEVEVEKEGAEGVEEVERGQAGKFPSVRSGWG